MMNMLIRSKGLIPANQAGAIEFSLSEAIRGAVRYLSTVSYLVLLGTTKCWVKTAGTPIEKTPTPPFTYMTDPLWHGFSMLHGGTQVVIVSNSGVDFPHYWDGGSGSFIPVSAAPKAKTYIGFLGRLVAGAVYDPGPAVWYINRLQWSEMDTITSWPLVGTSGYVDLVDEGDLIQRLWRAQANLLRILRRHSVWSAVPTANAFNPITLQYISSDGIFAPSSLQDIGQDTCIYMGEKDVYVLTGTTSPIGRKIRDELFAEADPARLAYAWSFKDSTTKEYYLVVDLLGGGSRAYFYYWVDNTWTRQSLTGITCLVEWYED